MPDKSRFEKTVSLLQSADTAGHVAKVLQDREFWNQWNCRPEAGLGAAPTTRIVTGASLTSEAMARGIAARFGAAGMEQWFPGELTTAHLMRWFPRIKRLESLATSVREMLRRHQTARATGSFPRKQAFALS